MTATSNGAARPEHAFPLGLIWLKGQDRVDFLGLKRVLSVAARIHEGLKAPLRGRPVSAVIYCPVGEDDLAAEEVGDIRVLALDAPVLVFASAPNLRLARAALRAGAGGLIHSGMSEEQVLRAVSVAIGGEVVLPRALLGYWRDEQRPPDLSVLSARQREILELVVEGLSNAQIARRLWLSESAIKQHLRATYKVLGIRNRNEAQRLPWLSGDARRGEGARGCHGRPREARDPQRYRPGASAPDKPLGAVVRSEDKP